MAGPFRLTDRAAREAEERALAPAAVRSTASRGRVVGEPEDPLRTAFERDRDRATWVTCSVWVSRVTK